MAAELRLIPAKLYKVRSIYAAKHHEYDLLDFYDMQNDADSMTMLKIGQNSELV